MTDVIRFPRFKADRPDGRSAAISVLRRYGIGLAIFAAALALRLLLDPLVGDRPLLALFLSGIIVAGAIAGLGPAVLVAGMTLLYDAVVKIVTDHVESADHINTVTFSILAVLICWLIERAQRADQLLAAETEGSGQRAFLAAMLSAVPDAAMIAEENGRIRLSNARLAAVFGYARREIEGMTIADLVPGWTGVSLAIGPVARHADGSSLPIELTIEDVFAAGERLLLCFVRRAAAGEPAGGMSPPAGGHAEEAPIALGAHSNGAEERRRALARIAELSPRERQVLEGLVIGKSNKMIALGLDISPRTVERHRANLMAKTRASSLSDLVRIALLAGISAGPLAEAAE